MPSSTSGYFQGIGALQLRQRPRRRRYERTGRLSYHASGVAHDMHADPGCTTERLSGTARGDDVQKAPERQAGDKRDRCEGGTHRYLLSAVSAGGLSATGSSVTGECVAKHDVVLEDVPLLRVGRVHVDRKRGRSSVAEAAACGARRSQ